MAMTELPDETLAELGALTLEPGRPLIAVDVDEVLVRFVPHLERFLDGQGYEMRLVRYELEGSMFPRGSDMPLPFETCLDLIRQFFEAETENQQPVPGGAEALDRLSHEAQIVILTNVPRAATAARRRNLDALGMPWPMVVNSGGKGRALKWMADRVQAPIGFVDDSVKQIESVARHLPGATRLHFAEADFIARIFPDCSHATAQTRSWSETESVLCRELGLETG